MTSYEAHTEELVKSYYCRPVYASKPLQNHTNAMTLPTLLTPDSSCLPSLPSLPLSLSLDAQGLDSPYEGITDIALKSPPRETILKEDVSNKCPPPLPAAVMRPLNLPPSPSEVRETAVSHGLPRAVHRKPFFSNPYDVQPAK